MIAPLIVAAALAAAPTPLLDAPGAQDLAVAGDEVIVTRGGSGGRLRVDALAVDGSAVRPLLATPRLGPRWSSFGLVFASPQQVAVLASWQKQVDDGPDRARLRLYIGPRAGPLRPVTTVSGVPRRRQWIPFAAAADGDRLLVEEVRGVLGETRLRLFELGAAPRVLPWGRDVDFMSLALAGEHVAFGVLDPDFRVVVADLETGRRQVSTKIFDPFGVDVAEDGTMLALSLNGLVTAGPGRPRRRVRGSTFLSEAVFAGASIAAVEFVDTRADRPAVLDPGAARPRPVGVSTRDLLVLDADPAGVGWIANGCVLYAPLGAAAPAAPPAGPCPRVELGFAARAQTLRGRRLRVAVDCVAAPAAGCNGSVILRVGGIASRGRFHVRAGRRRAVTVRLTRSAAQIVRARVRRRGEATLRMDWRAADARASREQRLLVVNRAN
ncbi:MAG TPA: hypothetical protein VFX51_25540 [Solirubrobacteraceae bacterium]|nr:hypothetical protein [Solirubrobacteraceae bacterium]